MRLTAVTSVDIIPAIPFPLITGFPVFRYVSTKACLMLAASKASITMFASRKNRFVSAGVQVV
jgi:hypothetical protein